MSANMREPPLAASKFFVLVFLNRVWGFELKMLSALYKPCTAVYRTHFFLACLLRKALSFCVAGDWISSEGETY